MYIGGEVIVREEDILFIVSRETALSSRDTRRALDSLIGQGRIDTRAGGAQRAYIAAQGERNAQVYASPVGAERLMRRYENTYDF